MRFSHIFFFFFTVVDIVRITTVYLRGIISVSGAYDNTTTSRWRFPPSPGWIPVVISVIFGTTRIYLNPPAVSALTRTIAGKQQWPAGGKVAGDRDNFPPITKMQFLCPDIIEAMLNGKRRGVVGPVRRMCRAKRLYNSDRVGGGHSSVF